jgi:hypothetical protein
MSQLIFKKMASVLADISAVGKGSTNTAQGYKFRGIDDMINTVHAVLKKHSVFVTTDVLEKRSETREIPKVDKFGNESIRVDKIVELTMKYTFHAEDGSSISSVIASEGLDSGDKATNKALSAALKYALIQTFQVPTADMEDGDADSPELGAKSPAKNLVKEIAAKLDNTATATTTEQKKTVAFKPKANKPQPAQTSNDSELDL